MLNRNKKTLIIVLAIIAIAGVSFQLANAAQPSAPENTAQMPVVETTATPSGTIITLNTSPFINASQCSICHGSNIDDFNNPGLIFKHDPHLARGIRCAGCHTEFPHLIGKTVKPSMDVCYNCHGLGHSNQGLVATSNCTLCHPVGFTRLPVDHTQAFKEKEHSKPANNNPFSCLACHGQISCVNCHNIKQAIPKDHGNTPGEKERWKKLHGAKSGGGNCSVCHDNAFCTSCHKTPMPHPVTWLGNHKDLGKNYGADCKVCHTDRKECSSCHHQFEKTTILTQKTCDRCHDDYEQSLTVLIGMQKPNRDKALIVHKAHFEMTKTEPFECSECHEREYVTAKGCYSFQLCYECHGRERGGSLIAKWGGQELCYRCHKNK